VKKLQVLVTTVTLLFLVGAAAPGSLAAEKGDPKAGKAKYDVLCVSCHGNSGKGDGPAAASLNPKPQNHTDGKHMNALTDKYLFDIVKGGGVGVGKSPLMPPWGGQLKDPEIWDVVAYIRSLAKSGK